MTTVIAAWQAALATEQKACFGYALLGPRLSRADARFAATCETEHGSLRDATAAAIAAAGDVPDAPSADYPALYPVPDAVAAFVLAVRLETECAAAWHSLYAVVAGTPAAAGPPTRTDAQDALTASAVRATRWRVRSGTTPATVAFPGA